jgi:hypothetical protein
MGATVLFYGSAEEAEGELVTGTLFRLRLDGAENKIVQMKAPDASNPPAPVWQADGSSAYFETDKGIYRLSSAGGSPELVWKGLAEGITISSDGFLLAFWRVDKTADNLVLYDLRRRSEVRTWRVPDRFESDKSGWDLAFAHDGNALYARTYDEASTSPLKRFDSSSGKVGIVNPNCYAVAEGKKAVYFISVSGTARSLHKIAAEMGRPILVSKNFGYDTLSRGGNPRWLVSQDYRTKQTVVLDTEIDTVKPIGKCESAAVLSDGKVIVVSGPEITVGDASCRPK